MGMAQTRWTWICAVGLWSESSAALKATCISGDAAQNLGVSVEMKSSSAWIRSRKPYGCIRFAAGNGMEVGRATAWPR